MKLKILETLLLLKFNILNLNDKDIIERIIEFHLNKNVEAAKQIKQLRKRNFLKLLVLISFKILSDKIFFL